MTEREAAERLGWRERRQELPAAQAREQGLAESLSQSAEKLRGMEPPGTQPAASRQSPSGC